MGLIEIKDKNVITVGKRKLAKARALIKKGRGKIIINKEGLEKWPEMPRLMITEPLTLAGVEGNDLDIKVDVHGGGVMAQAEAIRMSIARGIVDFYKDEKIKEKFLDYDRTMLVEDPRRTEKHKPSQSSKGPRHKRQTSFR